MIIDWDRRSPAEWLADNALRIEVVALLVVAAVLTFAPVVV